MVEIEKGRRRVTAGELRRFSDIYKVTLSWLACVEAEESDEESERIELAARELSKLRKEDLDRLLDLLAAFRGDKSA
jgi:transcriptional regulator with XRE-family HTH domain